MNHESSDIGWSLSESGGRLYYGGLGDLLLRVLRCGEKKPFMCYSGLQYIFYCIIISKYVFYICFVLCPVCMAMSYVSLNLNTLC